MKNNETSIENKAIPWREYLHIAGSVASITGISLLAVTVSFKNIVLGNIVGWSLGASLLLAALMGLIILLTQAGAYIHQEFGKIFSLIFYLVCGPFGIVIMIFLFRLIQELGVPFIVVLIHDSYPVPTP